MSKPSPQTSIEAEYPRWQVSEKERLEALVEAYFGLSRAFGCMALVYVIEFLVRERFLQGEFSIFLYYPSCALIVAVVTYVATYGPNRKAAQALEWSETGAGLVTFFTAFGSMCCCGFIGFISMQQVISNRLAERGVSVGVLLSKKQVMDQIDEL